MYKWLSIIFILISVTVSGQHKSTDTVFISKNINDSEYYMVYILKDGQTKYYRQMADSGFSFDRRDSDAYSESLSWLFHDTVPRLKKQNLGSRLPRHWLNLYLQKGKYYLYAPCDWGTFDRLIISDTTLINFNMDGPYAYVIDTFAQADHNSFVFGVKCAESITKKFTLYIIDRERQIAILDDGAMDNEYRYKLLVGAGKARKFPMMVNDCRMNKWTELDFDRPDFEKILKKKIQVR